MICSCVVLFIFMKIFLGSATREKLALATQQVENNFSVFHTFRPSQNSIQRLVVALSASDEENIDRYQKIIYSETNEHIVNNIQTIEIIIKWLTEEQNKIDCRNKTENVGQNNEKLVKIGYQIVVTYRDNQIEPIGQVIQRVDICTRHLTVELANGDLSRREQKVFELPGNKTFNLLIALPNERSISAEKDTSRVNRLNTKLNGKKL